jgi:hypothetical protein
MYCHLPDTIDFYRKEFGFFFTLPARVTREQGRTPPLVGEAPAPLHQRRQGNFPGQFIDAPIPRGADLLGGCNQFLSLCMCDLFAGLALDGTDGIRN